MKRSLVLALLVGFSLAGSAGLGPPVATAAQAECHTATQQVEKRHAISCAHAVEIATAAYGEAQPFPECPGDKAKRWRGWTLIADPHGQSRIVGTRFSKHGRSFTLSGGGVC